MAARWNIICIFMILCRCCVGNSFPVPLLIWSSKSLDVDDQILAGHTLSYEDIQDKYLDKLKSQSNTLCVFIQDKLSIDDFAVHQGTHMKHLKQILASSATSIVLPSVALHSESDQEERSNKLIEYFKRDSRTTTVLTIKDVPDLASKIKQLKTDGSNIILVHLPKAENEKDSQERSLADSDEIIGKISEELFRYFPDYIGLLTADMPRDEIMSGMQEIREFSTPHVRHRRDLESGTNKEKNRCPHGGILVKNSSLMLYIKNITLVRNNDTDYFKNTTYLKIENASVINDTAKGRLLSFSVPEDAFVNSSLITLSMSFNWTEIRWWCVNMTVSGTLAGEIFDWNFTCSTINAPYDKSYACQVRSNFSLDINRTLTFTGLQVQPRGVLNETFYNAYDCIGFFTPPIWMGLLSVGVLFAILYGGVLSLLSIKSMDRFDNPKDPTISIHNE